MNAKQTPFVNILRLHAEDLYSDYGHNKSARLLSQAADEIELLRSNALALLDEKNDYMDGVGDVLGQDHDGETLWAAAQRVMSECDRLRAELETERMRLVACSVIALANTPESAASARDMHPDYRSPYCDDVARAIDREIALRAELKYQTDNAANLQASIDGLHGRIRDLEAELAEERKPDCLLCKNYYEREDENDHALYRGCALRLRLTPSDCINGSEFISVGPVRLYEKEPIAKESAATATRLWGGDAHEM